MDILVTILAIVCVVIAAFVLMNQVWRVKLAPNKVSFYIFLLCAIVVAGAIFLEFSEALSSLSSMSTSASFVNVVRIAAAIIPLVVNFPLVIYSRKKENGGSSMEVALLQAVIVLFVNIICIFSGSHPLVMACGGLVNVLIVICFVLSNNNKYYTSVSKINNDMINAQLNHYETVRQSNFELRRIKHDMKNHLIVIKELSDTKRYDELDSYVDKLTGEIKASETYYRTGNDIADAIISDKTAKANKRGISLDVRGTLVECNMDPVDMCTILANLLDNAVEAVSKLYNLDAEPEHKVITLEFKKSNNFLFIVQSNYASEKMRTNDGNIISSKMSPDHGFGLYNLRNAVTRNSGEFKINAYDEKFIKYEFEVMIPLR